jgi:hypothetical protein
MKDLQLFIAHSADFDLLERLTQHRQKSLFLATSVSRLRANPALSATIIADRALGIISLDNIGERS